MTSREIMEGKSVCMGVWNSMRHDARVARSAGSLASNVAKVSVVAASWDPQETGRTRHELGFSVITTRRPQPWALAAGRRGVGVIGLLLRSVRAIPAYFWFMRALWRERPDIYHAHDLQALPWVWLIAKLQGAPIIYDAHEISADRTALHRVGGAVRILEGLIARRCDAMITTTDIRADYFVAEYGVERPVVLQNRPHFRDAPCTRKLRDALDLPEDLPIVLYQGGLQRGRGLRLLVEQVPHIPLAHFVFLGDGLLRDELRQRVVTLGVAERVHFIPAVPWQELAEWTASADVGVQLLENTGLNHYSTDSNKLFEYGMAGVAVIASDFPEIRRVVDRYGFGELVDPSDSLAVRNALLRLVNERDLRQAYARNAWRNRQQLSWETQEPALFKLYGRLLETN